MNYNVKRVVTRIGRKIVVYPKHSTIHGYENRHAQEIYEPYELTIYEDFISIRIGDDDQSGATVIWYSHSDIISFVEYQAEGFQPIQLKHPKSDGLGNVLQE